jgi:hypothetical protein
MPPKPKASPVPPEPSVPPKVVPPKAIFPKQPSIPPPSSLVEEPPWKDYLRKSDSSMDMENDMDMDTTLEGPPWKDHLRKDDMEMEGIWHAIYDQLRDATWMI